MAQRICSVPICDRPAESRGLCYTHYAWSRDHGWKQPTYAIRPNPVDNRPPIDRVMSRIDITDDGCWRWQGSLNYGYGQISVKDRPQRVHRITYEYYVGPIPYGMELDHLCRNRACCNPAHLEAVDASTNMARAVPYRKGASLIPTASKTAPLTQAWQHLRADNDPSGNPQRMYVRFRGLEYLNVVDVWDEGYQGKPAELNGIPELPAVDISRADYHRRIRDARQAGTLRRG